MLPISQQGKNHVADCWGITRGGFAPRRKLDHHGKTFCGWSARLPPADIPRHRRDYNKITLANEREQSAGASGLQKARTVFNACSPVPSGVLPATTTTCSGLLHHRRRGNKIVTPEATTLCGTPASNRFPWALSTSPSSAADHIFGTQITVTGVTLSNDSGESYGGTTTERCSPSTVTHTPHRAFATTCTRLLMGWCIYPLRRQNRCTTRLQAGRPS